MATLNPDLEVVPLQAIPNQTLQVTLGNQACQINLYQNIYGLFIDLFVGSSPVVQGQICRNGVELVPELYLGFAGNLAFVDTQGTQDPVYTGLGTRFLLIYVPPEVTTVSPSGITPASSQESVVYISGPQGPQGIQGPVGETGNTGPAGPPGPGLTGSIAIGNTSATLSAAYTLFVTSANFTTPRTWTLPVSTALSPGSLVTIADQFGGVSGSNTLTANTQGGDVMAGLSVSANTFVLGIQYGSVTFRTDGAGHWDVAAFAALGTAGANPTATAGPTAVNGVASTFMRSDAAPAVQTGSASQLGLLQVDGVSILASLGIASVPKATTSIFGIVKPDGTSVTVSGGVISSAGGAPANPTATAGPTAINGSAVTFLRSDGAPAVQLGSSLQAGLLQVDGTTITSTLGVITAVGGTIYSVVATNGSTDQTSAIQTALNAGGIVRLSPGTFKISSALTFPTGSACTLIGCGPGVTVINSVIPSGSADAIDVHYTARAATATGGIRDLSITGTSATTYGIDCHYANAGWFINNVWISGCAVGIRYRDSWYTQNTSLTLVACPTAGILLDVGVGGDAGTGYAGTGYFANIIILATMSPGTGYDTVPPTSGLLGNGIWMKQDGGSLWDQVEIWGATGAAILVQPPSGSAVGNQWFYGVVCDTCVGNASPAANGWQFDSTLGGTVEWMFLTSCWGSYNQNVGLLALGQSGNRISGLYIMGGTFSLNAYEGIVLDYCRNVRIQDANIWDNSFAVPGASPTPVALASGGVLIGNVGPAVGLLVTGNTIGNSGNSGTVQGNAVQFGTTGGTSSNVMVVMNDVSTSGVSSGSRIVNLPSGGIDTFQTAGTAFNIGGN